MGDKPPRYLYEPSRDLKALSADVRLKCAEGYRRMRRESPELARAVYRSVKRAERMLIDDVLGGDDMPGGLGDLLRDAPPDYSTASPSDLMGTTALTSSMLADTPIKPLEYIQREPPNMEIFDLIERTRQDIYAMFSPHLFAPAPKPNK